MFKRHADLMEKLTAGALLVGLFQEDHVQAFLVSIIGYASWWLFHHKAEKERRQNHE